MEQTENTLEVDLSEMNFAALNGLRERIEEKVREMREVGGPALREKFTEEQRRACSGEFPDQRRWNSSQRSWLACRRCRTQQARHR